MKKLLLIFIILTNLLPAQEDKRLKKALIAAVGEEDYLRINKIVVKNFDGKSFEELILKSKEFYKKINYSLFTSEFPELYEEDEWGELLKRILTLYPDFHQKPDLKIIRFNTAKIIHEYFDLEKDLKVWPDLLSNFDKLPERLELKVEPPALRHLRKNQNTDGSYGEKEKVYCTSMALLTFLSQGETPTSRFYSKNIKLAMIYLLEQTDNAPAKDINILMWAISETYSMTGISRFETKMEKLVPSFLKNFKWEIKENPDSFFLQSLALKSVYISGCEIDFYSVFKTKLLALNENDSIQLLAAKATWGLDVKISEDKKKTILTALAADNENFLKDLMLYQISARILNTHRAYKPLTERINSGKLKYKFNEDVYSKNEILLLEAITPTFIYGYVFPRYLPSSKKPKPTDIDNTEEGIDLVD